MGRGFIERAVVEADRANAFNETIDRVRRQADYGIENQRPEFDPKQQRELHKEQSDNRPSEEYHQSLEYHGFVWWPLEKLPMLDAMTLKTEGEWRNDKLTLAFTPTDLTINFPQGPEQFDRFIREEKLRRRVSKGQVDKKELIRVRRKK